MSKLSYAFCIAILTTLQGQELQQFREIPAHIAQENKAFKEAFINTEGEFKGDEILSSIQTAAGYKVGRILGCTLKEMNNGTCRPLKDSDAPQKS